MSEQAKRELKQRIRETNQRLKDEAIYGRPNPVPDMRIRWVG